MYIAPILASVLAFIAGVILLEVTRRQRGASKMINLLIIAVALLMSIFLAAEVSRSPEASGGHMFYLWVAYAVFCIFRRKRSTKPGDAEGASSDGAV